MCPVHLERISGLHEHVWLSKDGHQVARQASKNVNCGCTACVLKQNKLWIWGSVEEYRLRVLKNKLHQSRCWDGVAKRNTDEAC